VTVHYHVLIVGHPMRFAETYTEAMLDCMDAYPGCMIGHPGDIEDGGERTFVWDAADLAEDDDGSKAVAMIVKKERPQ
jgi:hypothetical protein